MSGSAPGNRRHRSTGSSRTVARPGDTRPMKHDAADEDLSWTDAPALVPDAEIEAMYLRASGTFYGLLGVEGDASPARIATAHAELARRFDPKHFAGRVSTRRMFQIEFVARTLKGAFLTLTEPGRRAAYDGALERGEVPTEEALKATGGGQRISAHTPPPRSNSAAPKTSERPTRSREDAFKRTTAPMPSDEKVTQPKASKPAMSAPTRAAPEAPAEVRSHKPRVVVTDGVNPVPPPRRDVPLGEPGTPGSLIRVAREVVGTGASRHVASVDATFTASDDPDVRVAMRHEGARQWKLAVTAWKAVCARRPDDVSAHLRLVCAACEGSVELALAADHARLAARLAPERADVEAALARVLLLLGSVAGARRAVRRALTLDPEHATSRDLARRLKA
jgi:hypothetical protein